MFFTARTTASKFYDSHGMQAWSVSAQVPLIQTTLCRSVQVLSLQDFSPLLLKNEIIILKTILFI